MPDENSSKNFLGIFWFFRCCCKICIYLFHVFPRDPWRCVVESWLGKQTVNLQIILPEFRPIYVHWPNLTALLLGLATCVATFPFGREIRFFLSVPPLKISRHVRLLWHSLYSLFTTHIAIQYQPYTITATNSTAT